MECLQKKCRACLEDSEQMYALFEIYENGLTLCDILESFVNIKVTHSEGLPNTICLECAVLLTKFYNFSITFKENHKKLSEVPKEANNLDCVASKEENKRYLNDEVVSVIVKNATKYSKEYADITEIDQNLSYLDNFDNSADYEEIIVCTSESPDNRENKNQYICSLHDKGEKFICEICGYIAFKKSSLADHMEGHTRDKKYMCEFCNKTFFRRSAFCRHRRIHTQPNKFVCEKCGKKFTASDNLNTHILLRHSEIRNFKCIICNETFALKATLDKHVRRHQQKDGVSKQFSCGECNVKYFDKSSLRRHYVTKHCSTKCHTSEIKR